MKNTRKKTISYILAAFILIAGIAALATQTRRIELLFEKDDIENALRNYFAAEMDQDFDKLYACLAPSSVYKCSHTYEEFLADVKDSPVRIAQYSIVDIYNLRKNTDKETYPEVQRFVQAEVDVILFFTDTNNKQEVNYSFTLLKEGGAWYKG